MSRHFSEPSLFHACHRTVTWLQDLWNAMEAQKADCDSIINSKSVLIAQIKKDLKTMDNDFARLLKQQMDDMNSMLKAMGEQLDGVSVACRFDAHLA